MTRQVLHFPEYACDVCGYTSAGKVNADRVKVSSKPPARWFEFNRDEKPSKRRHYCSLSCLYASGQDCDDFMSSALEECYANGFPLPEEVIAWWGEDYSALYEARRVAWAGTESASPSTGSATSPSTARSADSGSRGPLPKSARLVGFIFAIKE